MRDINKKFSVRYYLNLVLIDEEERRYFKQQVRHQDGVLRFKYNVLPTVTIAIINIYYTGILVYEVDKMYWPNIWFIIMLSGGYFYLKYSCFAFTCAFFCKKHI